MAITFQRNLSPFLTAFFADRAAQNRRTYNSQLAAEITLKDATVLRWATAAIIIDTLSKDGATVATGPLAFDGRLSGAPDLRITQTKAPDSGVLEVVNLDYLVSTAITDSDRVFERARIRLYLAFPKDAGTYEALVFFDGFLDELQADDETGQLSLIADINARHAIVGKEITQRCGNELGDSWCGVGLLPPGAECTKIHDDAEGGCAYWSGVFNGIPFLDPATPRGNAGNPGSPPWEDYPQRPDCPCAETTWFKSANGGGIHARDMKAGEAIYGPLDEIVVVEEVRPVVVDYRYLVETISGAKQIVSATHRFLTAFDDPKGKPATSWKFGSDGLIVDTPRGAAKIAASTDGRNSQYSFRPLGRGTVLRLTVSGSHRYWSGMEPRYYIGSHNRKEDWEIIY